MQTVKNRILVETEYLGANVSCISTGQGLVYVDSPFLPKDGKVWPNITKEETGKQIAYVINTDHHYDHVMGNVFLTNNSICHKIGAKNWGYLLNKPMLKQALTDAFPDVLAQHEADIDALEIPAPRIAFDQELILDMGDTTIQLEWVGGHSPATIMIYSQEDRVLFTGDNVEGQFPFFGQAHFGTWKAALEKMLTMDIDVVVPGHGQVGGKDMVETYYTFFQELEAEVKAFHQKGMTIDEMAVQSKTVSFFPAEETAADTHEAWIAAQFKSAAKAVLKDG